MSDSLNLTVVYEDAGEGWIMASIREFPGVFSQGRTREEAREMVRDALREMIVAHLERGERRPLPPDAPRESLEVTIGP